MHRIISSISSVLLLTCLLGASGIAQPLTPEREAALKAKDSFKECDACPEMVVVPAGSFTMGSTEEYIHKEGPPHVVTIARPFAAGKTEVTVDQFAAFVKQTGYDATSRQCITHEDRKRSWRNPGYPQKGSHPAACLSWQDAKAYVAWLSIKTGRIYRLLTEAEWEYAAGARTKPGRGPKYSFGNDANQMCRHGNIADQSLRRAEPRAVDHHFLCNDGHITTAPVGSFLPNEFGLHDMHGNLSEWTEDSFVDGYGGAPTDGSARTAVKRNILDHRAIRGSDFYSGPDGSRLTVRDYQMGEYGDYHVGIRVARTLASPGAPAPALARAQALAPERERALKAKDSFRECDICPEMVVMPLGSFTMGSPKNEVRHRDEREGPQHVVTFKRPFAVGKFEVTVDQFAAFVKETGYDAGSQCETLEDGNTTDRNDRSWRNPGYAQEGSHAAACLSWYDAKTYTVWLSAKTGKSYRLLSEAEWEYVARARTTPGSAPKYSFGDDEGELCAHANGADEIAKKAVPGIRYATSCSDGYPYTAPVGSFQANGFGLHDMHGNVKEWTEDCRNRDDESYRGAPADGSVWTHRGCDGRFIRGGSWKRDARFLRAAERSWSVEDDRESDHGFRVARTLSQ
jgi:formylglycine-generating enzyme required for sulfatase activity